MTDFEYILEQCRQFNEIFVDEEFVNHGIHGYDNVISILGRFVIECPNELFMSVNSIASIKDLAPKSKKMDAFIDLINNLVAPPWKEPF